MSKYSCGTCLEIYDDFQVLIDHIIFEHLDLPVRYRVGSLCDKTGKSGFTSKTHPLYNSIQEQKKGKTNSIRRWYDYGFE